MKIKVGETLKDVSKLVIASSLISSLVTFGSVKFVLQKGYSDNIYNNNKIKITEEEMEELFELLEEESGQENINDERDLGLIAAIDNPNLTDSERNVIFKLIDLIEEMPYINKEAAYANLKNLEILHVSEDKDSTLGQYNYLNNKIYIYEKDPDNDILKHELIHSLFINEETISLPEYFREGVTELLVNEYFSDSPYWENTSYPYEIAMVKILCDMVGSDLILETYTTGNMKLIEEELSKWMGNKETKTYLKCINHMFSQFEDNKAADLDDMSYFLEYSNNYFSKKYPESNEVHNSYEYNKELIILMKNSSGYLDYAYYLTENGYYVKPYFSKELIEKDKKHLQKKFDKKTTISF